MSDDPVIPDSGGEGAPAQMPVEAPRRASLTLRTENVREARIASMEAANRSLAEALKFIYRALLVVLVVLVGVFLLSGYQQVNQAERGIKVRFGAITNSSLQPGPTFSLPEPLGEIVRVSTAQRSSLIDRAFAPSRFDVNRPLDEQGMGSLDLDPSRDGSIITGDGGLAHLVLNTTYRVEDAASFVSNINAADEAALMESVIRRAAIHAAASVSVDELLNRGVLGEEGSSRESSVERTIRDGAQRALDAMDAGVTVDRVSIRSVFPPLRVRRDFNRVVEVDASARKAREEAEEESRRTLNAVAGSASAPILDLIEEYGRQLDLGNEAEAERLLGVLYEVFEGEHDGVGVEINGNRYAEVSFSGEAAQRISAANRNRQQLADDAERRARLFSVKLEQYRENEDYFVAREWSQALAEFLSKGHVQTFLASDLTLMLNNDPEVQRQIQREIQRRMTRETLDELGRNRQLWDDD